MGDEYELLLIPLQNPTAMVGRSFFAAVFPEDRWPMKSTLRERDLETADVAQVASARASWKVEEPSACTSSFLRLKTNPVSC